jgi:hypothetical protein
MRWKQDNAAPGTDSDPQNLWLGRCAGWSRTVSPSLDRLVPGFLTSTPYLRWFGVFVLTDRSHVLVFPGLRVPGPPVRLLNSPPGVAADLVDGRERRAGARGPAAVSDLVLLADTWVRPLGDAQGAHESDRVTGHCPLRRKEPPASAFWVARWLGRDPRNAGAEAASRQELGERPPRGCGRVDRLVRDDQVDPSASSPAAMSTGWRVERAGPSLVLRRA